MKEGKDKVARFECVFSKSGIKAKWFKGRQELFMGKKYNQISQGDLHVLEIREPRVDDVGPYKCTCLEKSTTASLDVDYPDPVFKFTRPLQKKYEQYTGRELVLECSTNHSKAQVKWYKGDQPIDNTDSRVQAERDTFGKHFLKIKHCREEDSDDYSCRIVNTEEVTKTKVTCTDRQFIFVKPLMSQKCVENETIILECEVDDREAEVKWFKDGKEISSVPKKMEIVAEGRKRKVIIKKGKVTDEAQYTCKTNGDSTECEILVERKFTLPAHLHSPLCSPSREQVPKETAGQDCHREGRTGARDRNAGETGSSQVVQERTGNPPLGQVRLVRSSPCH